MNETKKALECCVNAGNCVDCPLNRADIGAMCVKQNMINALDLINRYEAETEIMKEIFGGTSKVLTETCAGVRVKAIKEFAERLVAIYENDKRYDRPHAHTLVMTLFRNIDNLVKEMVGEG